MDFTIDDFKNIIEEKNSNIYNIKIVKAGYNTSIKKYSNLQVRKKIKNDYKKIDVCEGQFYDCENGVIYSLEEIEEKRKNNEINKIEFFYLKEKYEYQNLSDIEKKIVNKCKTLKRSREKIKNIINTNLANSKNVKFLTLTFKKNITCVKTANKIFKNFIKRLNYCLKQKVKYVSVLENQQRGAIHYHMILFDCPYIPHDKYVKLWGQGSVNIQCLLKNNKVCKITFNDEKDFFIENEKIKNVGAYLTKTIDYMVKSIKDINIEDIENKKENEKKVIFTENAKIYQCSKNLLQEENYYLRTNKKIDKVIQFLNYFFFNEIRVYSYETELTGIENYNFVYKEYELFEEMNEFFNFIT